MSQGRIIISAPASGQGKTTATMGIMAALKKRGVLVQPYKVGPDYIDTAFHTKITGIKSINLDSWLLDENRIKEMFVRYSSTADISIIEGVMGLYDGASYDLLGGSTAGISKLLGNCPVIIVMQCNGMSGSAAAIVHGLKELKGINVSGVIINKPSSIGHYNILKNAIEANTSVKVLGFLPNDKDIEIKSRHLGLVQSSEIENMESIINRLATLAEENIDIDGLINIANSAIEIQVGRTVLKDIIVLNEIEPCQRVKIYVALDKAFSFYYHENIEILKKLGADIAFFSPMEDETIPIDCCGVYIGGGYPEVFARELSRNISMRQSIFTRAQSGLPIFAECGGYMYLNKSFKSGEGEAFDFVGFFEGESIMTQTLQNFGYAEIISLNDNCIMSRGDKIRAHEFHKSQIVRKSEDYCIKLNKAKDGMIKEWCCGMERENVFGMYAHIYFPSNMKLPEKFIKTCRNYKRSMEG